MGGVCESSICLKWVEFQIVTGDRRKAFDDCGIDNTGHVKLVSQHQYAAGNEDWVRLGSQMASFFDR